MGTSHVILAWFLLCAVSTSGAIDSHLRDKPTRSALFDYVNKPDDTYTYEKLDWTHDPSGNAGRVYMLTMTSQTWQTENEVDNPVWKHFMVVYVPNDITSDTALLHIGGGNNDIVGNYYPNKADDMNYEIIVDVGEATGSVTAMVLNVPNQPIVFSDDPHKAPKVEDEILSWTFDQFLKSKDPYKIAHLPMTKAVVRAMDTVTDFVKNLGRKETVEKFVLTGASKRGWATFLGGIVDNRVAGIVPQIFDLLNMREIFRYSYRSLGGWSIALKDYFFLQLTKQMDDDNFKDLTDIVDPFVYRDLLTMPKYMVSAVGDEFFLLDNTYQYYNELKGETLLRSFANARHGLYPQRVEFGKALLAFFQTIVKGNDRPKITWTMNFTPTGGELVMKTNVPPKEVRVESAQTAVSNRRDFRANIGMLGPPFYRPQTINWTSTAAKTISPTEFSASFNNPDSGWLAFHIYAIFPGAEADSLDIQATTENMVIPNTYPYPDCNGAGCYGHLVRREIVDQE